MTDIPPSIESFLSAYRAAVFAKDVDALVALYDREVVVFDTWDAWAHTGLDAWRDVVQAWFGSLGSERVAVEFSEVRAGTAPGWASVHAMVRYAAVTPGGAELRALTNRFSAVLRLVDGHWKVIHEHTSAPIDGATGKAKLAR